MNDSYEDGGEEICCHDSVLLKKACASSIAEIDTAGTLSLVKRTNGEYIEWKPNEPFLIASSDTQEQDDWSFVDKIARRNRTESETMIFNSSTNQITIKEKSPSPNKSKTIRAKVHDLTYLEILSNACEISLNFMGSKGKPVVHSQYFFQQRNVDNFIRNLQSYNLIRQSTRNRRVYDVIQEGDINFVPQRTFDALNITDIKNSRSTGMINDFFIKVSEIMPSPSGTVPYMPPSRPPPQPNERPTSLSTSGGDEYEDLAESFQNPFEDQIKELEEKLPERKKCSRGQPMTQKMWHEFQSEDGRISDVDKIREIIFRGGIEDSFRFEVWKYLLKYYQWEQSREQRIADRETSTKDYFTMKLQWRSFTKVQEDNFSGYRDRKCQIEKDVKRTDRAETFFAGDNNPNLDSLQDILMTYIMYNFDLGYVQGMNDLLAPILCVMQNEQDSFWCFAGFMAKIFNNFDIDQEGMKTQLAQLSQLISFVCPRLYYYFKEANSDNMYFCFRWLLVWYKREFSPADVRELWEVLWTGLPCPNFHLFIGVAILEKQMSTFIDNRYEFTDILKHINDLSLKINLKETLESAEAIYYQIKESKHLNDQIRIIIGEEPIETTVDGGGSDTEDEYDKHNSPQTKTISTLDEEDICEIAMQFSLF